MLDKWFLDDIKRGLQTADRFVIIDDRKTCGFLLEVLKKGKVGRVFEAHGEVEELRTKYEIEKDYAGQPAVVFTTIPLDKLTFLREYCETGGCLPLTRLHRYLEQKVNEKAGFDLPLPPEELIAIGKLSIGKKQSYWKRIKANGTEGVFTTDDILTFLRNPEKVFQTFGKEEQDLFSGCMSCYTPYPLANKPPRTIADELATAIFDSLFARRTEAVLERVYRAWLDSKKYEAALKKYAAKYQIPAEVNIWDVPLQHPFKTLAQHWLQDFIAHLDEPQWIHDRLFVMKERGAQAAKFLDAGYWQDIVTLFSYDPALVEKIQTLDEAITHYTQHLQQVDNAMRHLYTRFLSDTTIIQPLQEYYEQIIQPYLHKWFSYLPAQYRENQTGLLKRIIRDANSTPPVAIIVGDAISYEIAQEIVQGLSPEYKAVPGDVICGNYPSMTDNGMSSLFVESGELLPGR